MIYMCSKCGTETRPPTGSDNAISHGLCTACVTTEHVKIDEMPTCGLEGTWGECNLFDGHVGECRELSDE